MPSTINLLRLLADPTRLRLLLLLEQEQLSVAELQESARVMQATVTPDEWPRLVAAAASLKGNAAPSSDVAALLQAARAAIPTAEELAQWKQLVEQFGGSSWGDASSPA